MTYEITLAILVLKTHGKLAQLNRHDKIITF